MCQIYIVRKLNAKHLIFDDSMVCIAARFAALSITYLVLIAARYMKNASYSYKRVRRVEFSIRQSQDLSFN